MKYPPPYPIEVAVEPKDRHDAERLLDFLKSTFGDDDGVVYSQDWESGQTILRGPSRYRGARLFARSDSKASPRLLEPITMVAVTMLEQFLGPVIGDLNRRRGQVTG